MSPQGAVMTCSKGEMKAVEEKPDDLIGGCSRFMDDVVGIMAVSTREEEQRARRWFDVVKACYPAPLELNVDPETKATRFLEMVIETNADHITCRLHNSYAEAVRTSSLFVPRLPDCGGGTRSTDRRGIVTGFLYRALHGSLDLKGFATAVGEFMAELERSEWALSMVRTAMTMMVKRARDQPLARQTERLIVRGITHLVGDEPCWD